MWCRKAVFFIITFEFDRRLPDFIGDLTLTRPRYTLYRRVQPNFRKILHFGGQIESVLRLSVFRYFFFGVARFRMCIGSSRRAASRLLKLKTLKTQPQSPKDTARTLKIQRAACYSRVSGSMSAHLVHVKNRSCQRVARFRICTGGINSRMTSPAPGPQ